MSDGHDTQCRYNKCAHPEAGPCPFVRDERSNLRVEMVPDECEKSDNGWHEWRQLALGADHTHVGFYCIYCLTINEKGVIKDY